MSPLDLEKILYIVLAGVAYGVAKFLESRDSESGQWDTVSGLLQKAYVEIETLEKERDEARLVARQLYRKCHKAQKTHLRTSHQLAVVQTELMETRKVVNQLKSIFRGSVIRVEHKTPPSPMKPPK